MLGRRSGDRVGWEGSAPRIPGYEGLTPIGQGGFAVVFRARATAFDRDVAIKVLSRRGLDEHSQRRFERERRVMGRLSAHPNIVTVYDAGLVDKNLPYLVMEYLPRGSLADQLQRRGALPWKEAVAIGVKLAGALEAAHRAGVLHRDVKPENVMVSAYGEPELGDFGIAKALDSDTRSSETNLSVPYAAPELVNGAEYTERSDIYALGATVFALLWGGPPFARQGEDSFIPMLMRISSEAVPDLRPRGVPAGVALVLERAMEKAPEDRYPSALAFAEELQAVQAGLTGAATPVPVALPEEAPVEAVPTVTEPVPPPTPTPRDSPVAADVEPDPVAGLVDAIKHAPPAARRRIPVLPVVAGAVALLVVIAGMALAAREDDDDNDGDATASASTTVVAAAAPSTAPPTTVAPAPFPGGTNRLAPGAYASTRLALPLQFTVGEGWQALGTELPELLVLKRVAGSRAEALSFGVVERVLDPAREYPDNADFDGAEQPLPADLVAWLRAHPRLDVGEPEPARVAGVDGVRVEVRVTDGYPCRSTAGSADCAALFPVQTGGFLVLSSNTNHLSLFRVGDRWFMTALEAPAVDFAASAAAAGAVVASIAFR